eukprot:gene5185-3730_t
MKFVIQRVSKAAVHVGEEVVGSIEQGVSVLVGVVKDDTTADMESLARKLLSCRLWPDENGKPWSKNIRDINGGILLISQFTLAHVMKGTKPDFHNAMKPEEALEMFNALRDRLRADYCEEKVQTGQFQAYMHIPQVNDGPVTLQIYFGCETVMSNLPSRKNAFFLVLVSFQWEEFKSWLHCPYTARAQLAFSFDLVVPALSFYFTCIPLGVFHFPLYPPLPAATVWHTERQGALIRRIKHAVTYIYKEAGRDGHQSPDTLNVGVLSATSVRGVCLEEVRRTTSMAYTPTREDIVSVIHLLHDNGVKISNSKAAYEQLKQYEANPAFCVLLSSVFASTECPVAELGLHTDWTTYRQLAGLTLKNNLDAARHQLGEDAVKEAARCALSVLSSAPNPRMARVSAQIVVKITSLTSFEWWSTAGLGDLPSFLLNDLLQAGGVNALGALYALQYIMEDLPAEVGQASENIIVQVSSMAKNSATSLDLRKAAFRMSCNSYEQASFLDWNIDHLSSLQTGLAYASWTFADTCTTLLENSCIGDMALMIDVLRSCWFLVDYFRYFPPDVLSAQQARLQGAWISFALQVARDPGVKQQHPEIAAAAIDLISRVLDEYDATGGEGDACFLVDPISGMVRVLIDSLVGSSFLSEEEVADIMETDDYRHRNCTGVIQSSEEKDIAEDNFLDGSIAAMTLRSSAIKCIDSICQFEGNAAASALMGKIELLWRSEDWKAREVGFVLLGTMAESCYSQLEKFLPGLVQQVIQGLEKESEHICVTSMAIWSLTRMLENACLVNLELFTSAVNAIGAQLKTTSKRIQQSAVTGLTQGVTVLEKNGAPSTTKVALFSPFTGIVCECLPVYHTGNLSLLIDFVIRELPFFQGMEDFNALAETIKRNRSERAASFEASYTAAYVLESTNTLVDKDIFSLDRAVIALLTLQPDSNFSASSLKTWADVLRDVLTRGVTDDADLVFNTLLTCAGYVQCVPTRDFQPWMTETFHYLSEGALQLWKSTPHKLVKVACVTLLGALAAAFGPNGVSNAALAAAHEMLVQDLPKEDDPQFKNRMVSLGAKLVMMHPSHPSSMGTYSAMNAVLRSDVFGESLLLFIEMAESVCMALVKSPEMFLQCTNILIVLQLLTQSTNDGMKSDATIHLCSVLGYLPPNTLAGYVPDLMRLVYSWQQVAPQFPGTVDALKSAMLTVGQQCDNILKQTLDLAPPGLVEMVRLTYQI